MESEKLGEDLESTQHHNDAALKQLYKQYVRILLILVICFSYIGFAFGRYVERNFSNEDEFFEEARFQLRVMSFLKEKQTEADRLAQEKKQLEAARLYINLAGAERIFSISGSMKQDDPLYWFNERKAVSELKTLSADQPYFELLKKLYPDADVEFFERSCEFCRTEP